MADPESTTVIGTLATAVVILLGKLGWDHRKKSNFISIGEDDLTPDTKPTRRDTLLMVMTDRIHKVREDLAPQIGKLQLEDAKMDLRIAQNRDDISRLRVDMEAGFRDINAHIDRRCDDIKEQIEKSVDRIWSKLDSK